MTRREKRSEETVQLFESPGLQTFWFEPKESPQHVVVLPRQQ